MPTYDFRCKSCGHRFEITRPFSEDGIPACPSCAEQNEVVKVFPKEYRRALAELATKSKVAA